MRANTTQFALLGMLSLRPMSGYDIRKTVQGSIAFFWTESYGQIYPMLKQLSAEGLVKPVRAESSGRRNRNVYALTPKGRTRLRAWLAEPVGQEPARSELLLKIFFARHMDKSEVAGHLQRTRAEHHRLLERYAAVERKLKSEHGGHPDLPYWLATLRFGQLRSEAIVRWCDETAASITRKRGQP